MVELSGEDTTGLELDEVVSDVFDRGEDPRTANLSPFRFNIGGFCGRSGSHNG